MSYKNDFKKEVEDLQNTYHQTYKINPSLFTAAYNNESQMSQDYNGRQILELLQNADDAKAQLVKFTLNKSYKTLTIANTGNNPFSSKGVESLMLANNSPKDSNESIGNKGLGFRAVVAWCNEIIIYSNKTKIEFSRNIIKRYVCDSDEKLCLGYTKEQVIALNKEKKIKPKETIPFPLLGMPKITDIDNDSLWTTEILLKYKNEEKIEKSILSQLELDENILLFLNHIQDIEIEIVEDSHIIEKKTIHKEIVKNSEKEYKEQIFYKRVNIGNEEWNLLSKCGIFPDKYQTTDDEEEFENFSTMIAWQDNLNSYTSYPLCCYFPTQIQINLPFVIHGNFEVNAARNLLVSETTKESRNDFLFENILKLIDAAVEIEQEKSDISNWNSFKILHTTTSASNGLELFIEGLNNRLNTMKIYPSISNNNYLTKTEYKYYSKGISDFFQDKFASEFSDIIKQPDDLSIQIKIYEPDDFFEKINNLKFDRSTEIEDRGDLIKLLFDFNRENKYTPWIGNNKANLLVNSNFEPIGKEKTAYINSENPSTDYKINKPEYVKFELAHQQLNNDLYKKLKVSSFISQKSNDNNPKRKLCEMIESFIDVDDFDITAITKKIISRTNELLDEDPSKSDFYIKEMTKNLYENYKERRNEWGNPDYPNIKFLNKNKQIMLAQSLYFSKSYNSNNLGDKVEFIFDGINCDSDYLLPFSDWGFFPIEEIDIVCDFFAYFGINEFITTRITELDKTDGYFSYCRGEISKKYPSNYRVVTDSKNVSFLSIKNIEKIKLINNISKLVLAIFWSRSAFGTRDTDLLNKIKINTDSLLLHYGQDYPRIQVVSYVVYQLITTGLFANYFIDETEGSIYKLINKNNILDTKLLIKNSINKKDAFDILLKLKCKTNLSEYEPEFIYSLLNSLKDLEEYKTGAGTQSIYFEAKQALVEICKRDKTQISIPNNMYYYVYKNGIGSYKSINDEKHPIYYFDNNSMPKSFLEDNYILNMKKRAGEDAFRKYFGTKNKENISIKLTNIREENCPNKKFEQVFKRLKPYILAYRFSYAKLDDESKEKNAKDLEALSIRLISFGNYQLNNKSIEIFEDYEFFYSKETLTYYLKVPENIDFSILAKKSEFQNAFSEIVCSTFKLTDNILVKDLRLLISYDENELRHRIEDDKEISISDLDYCKKRLNIKDSPFYNFWKELFILIELDEILPESSEELRTLLEEKYQLKKSILSYKNYEDFNSYEGVLFLREIAAVYQLDISILLKRINQNLLAYNKENLEKAIDILRPKFITLLWNYCYKNNKQEIYINELIAYEKKLEEISKKNDFSYLMDENYQNIIIDIIKRSEFKFDLANDIQLESHEELPEYKNYTSYLANDKERFLLYFPGNEKKLESKVNKVKSDLEDENKKLENDLADYEDIEITTKNVTCKKPLFNDLQTPSVKNAKYEKPHIVDENDSRKKRNAGIRAEKLVKAYFKKHNIKFEQRSGMSKDALGNDNNHYDFYYYKYIGATERKVYVEVKSSTDGSFFMSEAERKFAEEHADRYELALVNIDEKSITFVENAFSYINDTNKSFSSNENFFAAPIEYYVHLKISE